MKKIIILALIIWPMFLIGQKQKFQVLDKIIAIVGDEIILQSDLITQKSQALSSGFAPSDELDCSILENLLFENLLLHQAKLDSVEVSEGQIEAELDRRIAIFSEQMQGEDKLEEFYGKTITEIKMDFYDVIKDQIIMQTAQAKISEDFDMTPADVTDFYASFNKDSLPFINSQVEISQIMIKPVPSEEEVQRVKDQLNDYRRAILAGEKEFTTVAVLYSEDPGSAAKGGELGMVGKGRMVPEFEAVAYNLAEGEVSKPFESDFGYHIMQMIERKGNLYNARHILLRPKISNEDLQKSKDRLIEIQNMLKTDTITFEQAALEFSEDEGTKHNNGLMINPATGSIRFEMNEIDPNLFFVIDKLQVGEISEPVLVRGAAGKEAYRIVKLRYRSEPHQANLKEDYQLIQSMAESQLSAAVVDEWIEDRLGSTYVKVEDEFKDCKFQHNWLKLHAD